jgi:hypothetical protein
MNKKIAECAPMSVIKNIQEDISDFIKKEEFNIWARDMDFLRKDLGKLCSKEELMTRLNVFNSDVNIKLHDRPTIAYFKKVLSAYDSKIE